MGGQKTRKRRAREAEAGGYGKKARCDLPPATASVKLVYELEVSVHEHQQHSSAPTAEHA